jgi:hypothetical protein
MIRGIFFGFQCENQSGGVSIYGYKGGKNTLHNTYAYYPENYNNIKIKDAEFNRKRIQ